MKRIFYILFLIFSIHSIFANDLVEYPSLPTPKVPLEPISSDKYSYFTLGSSIALQNVGIGQRYRNSETLKGHDINLNAYFSLPGLAFKQTNNRFPLYPSVKYTYLNYSNNSPNSPYFGIACEGGLVFDSHRYDRSLPVHFVPNIGLVWGKERENMRFSQLQINAIPALGVLVGTGLLIFGSDHGAWIPERDAGILLALSSTSVLFSYSAGF